MAFNVSVAETPVARKAGAGRPPIDNPFSKLVTTWDDGKARTINPDKDSKVSTLLDQLRRAAKEIDRSVTVEFLGGDGSAKTATGFKFQLRALITRPRTPKGDTDSAEKLATPAKAPKAPTAPLGSRPAKRAAAKAGK